MRYKFILNTISLLIILSFNSIKIDAQEDPALRYLKNPAYKLQVEMYDIYKTRQANIVMLGNSLTNGANWNELLGRNGVAERGVPSDILQGFAARINYIYKLNPKIVFICGGLNDIYNWIPTEEVYSEYVSIINKLKSKNIIPVIQTTTYSGKTWAKDWGGTPEVNAGRNREVDKLNKMLFDFAQKNNVDIIDLNAKTAGIDRFLRPELTWDGIHFNAKGYKIWAAEVEKVLSKYKL
ncbi:MAG: GDSL-type esterase/lipase family protein [Melioribacteraceae bacterium]